MDQNLLRQVVMYGDQNAESACIAQYLGTLEVICSSIAGQHDFDAEELLSEGYVHLVDTFQQMIQTCRNAQTAEHPDGADQLIANMSEQLTHHLKMSLTQYISQSKRGHIQTISSDAIVDTEHEPIGNELGTVAIPKQLIDPFTEIANLCHATCGYYRPTGDARDAIIAKLMMAYRINITEAAVMLNSYENYVEAILNERFQSSH